MSVADEIAFVQVPWDLIWRVRLSGLYHLKRERFLDGADKFSKAVSALGGAAAFSQFKSHNELGLWVVGFITVVATMSLVYGPSARARKHAELARDFKRLEAEIAALGVAVSCAQIARLEAQYLSIESSEPAALGALVTHCHNELAEAIGDKSQITPLSWWQKIFKNWVDFDQSTQTKVPTQDARSTATP